MSESQTNTTSPDPSFVPHENEAAEAAVAADKPEIYGSFWIGDSEFAFPVSAIREVVNEPAATSVVPLAPPFLKGLFNLRGMAIPIVDLRIFLELPAPADAAKSIGMSKVAIIEDADRCVGVLFERAGKVLNEPRSASVNFRNKDSNQKGAVINGVLALEGGDRMVQTIDPHKLIHVDNMPQAKVADQRTSSRRDLGKRLRCLSFQLGHTSCAIDLRFVQEVREMPIVEKSALAHGFVIGTVNLRGTVIPVIDFRSYMGPEPVFSLGEDVLRSRKLVVIETKGGPVGLMVFSIDSIIPFFEDEVRPFAKLSLPRGTIVKGSLTDEESNDVVLLDHEQLMSDADLTDAAQSCKNVHHEGAPETEKVKTSRLKGRKTFILFTLGNCFAMDSDVVIEIINKPEELLQPSFAGDFVEGIINLRGDLITLINPRLIYGLDENNDDQQKVLVFMQNGQKYAILVDSVDEMVTTTADKVLEMRETGYPTTMDIDFEDVVGVLQCARQGKTNQMTIIMDSCALVERCAKAIN